ncbi:MAG: O-antigen ligase family protein [Alphaproteobacteria bacterium]
MNALLVAVLLVWTSIWQKRCPHATSSSQAWVRFPATAFCLTAAWLALQALPFAPASLMHPAWSAAQELLGAPSAGSVSLTPALTLIMLLQLLTLGAFFWCGLHLAGSWRRASVVVHVVFAMTIAYATYGLVLDALQSTTILWYEKWVYRDALTSTHVNRNAFASFAGAGCLAGLALFFQRMQKSASRLPTDRVKALVVVSSELFSTSGLIVSGVLLLLVALVLTGSRAGLVATVLGIAVFIGLVARHKAGVVLVAVLALVVALALSGDFLSGRWLGTAENWELRRLLFEGTLRAIGDRPLLGYGGGSFTDVFGLYMPEDLGTQNQFRRAHNTYLELALELGIPSAIVVLSGFMALAVRLFRGVRQRRGRRWLPALALGVGVVFATHSLIDFPLQIQANAFVFLSILAAGLAQTSPRNAVTSK